MDLILNVNKQKLTRTDTEYLVDETRDYLRLKFSFDSSWLGFTRRVLFRDDEDSYLVDLTSEGDYLVCTVPSELLSMNNFFTITVVGTNDTVRVTTNYLGIALDESLYTTDLSTLSGESAEDVFDVLLNTKYDNVIVSDGSLLFYANSNLVKTVPLGSVSTVSWSNVTGKPSSFTPSEHTHTLASCTEDVHHRTVTDAEKTVWSAKQDSISDLSTIRSGASLGSTALQVGDNVSELVNDVNYLTSHQSLTDYYKKSETNSLLNAKADTEDLSTVATTGSYTDLSNKPTIPSKTSDLENDGEGVTDKPFLTEHQSLTDYVQKSDIINDVTHQTVDKPLSANMGKELQDQIDNLSARGRFLALWNCSTGLAMSNPTTSPYTYKTGDYYVVGAIANGYTHNISISGSTIALNGETGTYNVSFSFNNQVSSAYTNPSDVALILGEDGVTATGSLVTPSETYIITSVQEWEELGVKVIAMRTSDMQKAGLTVTGATTLTDNVTGSGGTTNYKPNGATYTIGVASSTVESNTVGIDDVYYYDGSNWRLQVNTQKTVSFANLSGYPSDNSNLASALDSKADSEDIPTKTSDLTNDSGFITNSYHDSSKQDTLTAGTNVSITNNVISATDTTYNDATTSIHGLMSTSDKTKLDSITVANLELNTNKATSISGSIVSEDNTYPTRKAVVDYINSLDGDNDEY